MRGPNGSLYHDTNWNKICLDNEWDVRTQERLSANCYQSGSWWRRWLGSEYPDGQNVVGRVIPPHDLGQQGGAL
jgi:hypothetical protein